MASSGNGRTVLVAAADGARVRELARQLEARSCQVLWARSAEDLRAYAGRTIGLVLLDPSFPAANLDALLEQADRWAPSPQGERGSAPGEPADAAEAARLLLLLTTIAAEQEEFRALEERMANFLMTLEAPEAFAAGPSGADAPPAPTLAECRGAVAGCHLVLARIADETQELLRLLRLQAEGRGGGHDPPLPAIGDAAH